MTLTGESGASVPSIALNDENTMPALGLGVAELSDGTAPILATEGVRAVEN